MSESTMAVVKPEMKSYVWLQTVDGSIQQVEEEVAKHSPIIRDKIVQKNMGSSKINAIVLPERVKPVTLGLILDYCRFHQEPGHSNKELKAFDDKFIRLDTRKLSELTSAADTLQLKSLVDLTSRTLARIIEDKPPEEIRGIFNLPDDLTEEEKLEPLKNVADDPRIRLLNRLNARKMKELKEREPKQNTKVDEDVVDERSVDDLLAFINGGNKESRGAKAGKNKKRSRKKKTHSKMSSPNNENSDHKASIGFSQSCQNGSTADGVVAMSVSSSQLRDAMSPFLPKLDFDDGDVDNELDPAMKEELDREVEDFARRLSSDWPKRKQGILSLGQGRRFSPVTLSGNRSSQRLTGLQRR